MCPLEAWCLRLCHGCSCVMQGSGLCLELIFHRTTRKLYFSSLQVYDSLEMIEAGKVHYLDREICGSMYMNIDKHPCIIK